MGDGYSEELSNKAISYLIDKYSPAGNRIGLLAAIFILPEVYGCKEVVPKAIKRAVSRKK